MTNSPAFDLRLSLSLGAGKLAGAVSRIAGKGGGTAAPGLVATRLDSGMLSKLAGQLPQGIVLVTGTNGKTTTSRILADIAEANGWEVAHNRSGANLVRGVVAMFVENASITGKLSADIAVIEIDEASLPVLAQIIQPRIILLNNLYADQVDRYGSPDEVAKLWRTMMQQLSPSTHIVVNADDARLVGAAQNVPLDTVMFGLQDENNRVPGQPAASDAVRCPQCGGELAYHARYIAHLGDWYCTNCDAHRPELQVDARDIQPNRDIDQTLTLHDAEGHHTTRVGVPGLYNAYNALAAATAARTMGISWDVITSTLATYESAFGRLERFSYKGRTFTMILAKNPAGYNEVLRMIIPAGEPIEHPVLIGINNRVPDGEDATWINDAEFNQLAAGEAPIFATGMCAAAIAAALQAAGVADSRIHVLSTDPAVAMEAFTEAIPQDSAAYLLPNYTVMQEIREPLAAQGVVPQFWKE